MKIGSALGSGLAGAISLTLLHEATRRVVPSAPRLDVLGMRALANILRGMDQPVPPATRLHRGALIGDLVANTLYYSLVGVGKDAPVWRRGTLLGLAAGLGAVVLPGPLGLGRRPSARTIATRYMTVGGYLAGSLIAAAVATSLTHPTHIQGDESRQRS